MHVVLVNPRSQKAHRRLPLSVLFLARALPERHTWELFDQNVDPLARERAEAALARDQAHSALFVTVMPGPQLREATPWCRAVKARLPAVRVVWGGYFPTVYPDAVARDPGVDLVCIGQGEDTAVALLDALEAGDDPLGVPGVAAWRDGALRRAPARGYRISSKYPDPPYERLDMERYAARTFLGRRTFNHHASVGCPYTCNFCAVTTMFEGRWLPDPAADVVRIATRLHHAHGADALEFHDNNFFAAERRAVEVARGITPLGLSWWGEGRIDTMLRWTGASWEALARSGLRMVFYGAESGDQAALDAMNKGGLQVEETLALNRLAQAHGVVPEFSFVLGNPGNTAEEAERSLALVRRLKADNPACEIILYLYTPVPLPGMYDEAVAQGFAFPERLDDWLAPPWDRYESRRRAVTPWVDPGLVRRIYDFEAVLHARWPSASDRNLRPWQRTALRVLATPRWRHARTGRPWEIQVLQRLWHYRRPEEMGF
jgi:anaerobic magnesium-protoporphyrin IX monomethyl ester cyclase